MEGNDGWKLLERKWHSYKLIQQRESEDPEGNKRTTEVATARQNFFMKTKKSIQTFSGRGQSSLSSQRYVKQD